MTKRRRLVTVQYLITILWTLAVTEAFVALSAAVRPSHHDLSQWMAAVVPMDQSQSNELMDTRPHAQRAKGPRPARRLNQALKYLYRHDCEHYTEDMDPVDYFLAQGVSRDQIKLMNETFPPLLTLSVKRHLHPKMRFLKETLGITNNLLHQVPPHFFGARLEATVAPRHAFLVHQGLVHGQGLLQPSLNNNATLLLDEFLVACRDAKRFAALCQSWRQTTTTAEVATMVTPQQIKAFDVLFARGLMAAARNEQNGVVFKEAKADDEHDSTWPLDFVNVTAGSLVRLLVQHGANPRERDRRGATLLHWTAGTGNSEGLVELLAHFNSSDDHDGVWVQTERDGATPLHWAVAGCNARHFGTGGHATIAQRLLSRVQEADRDRYMNQSTKDGNTALMWAAWSGSLDCVQLLVENGAAASGTNRNGCSLAHWATSGTCS